MVPLTVSEFTDTSRVRSELHPLRRVTNVSEICRCRLADAFHAITSQTGKASMNDPTLPDVATPIMTHITTPHYLAATGDFRQLSVPYCEPSNTHQHVDHEIETDLLIDRDALRLDSMAQFHDAFIGSGQNTHLLLGHRGCGKSAFMHHYFRAYPDFVAAAHPYIIVNFLNFGFVPDNQNLSRTIIDAVWRAITQFSSEVFGPAPATTLGDLFDPDVLAKAVKWLEEVGAPFKNIINDDLMRSMIAGLGEVTMQEIRHDDQLGPREDREHLHDPSYRASYPFQWLLLAARFFDERYASKPWSFFAEWILARAFDRDPRIPYCGNTFLDPAYDDIREEVPHAHTARQKQDLVLRLLKRAGGASKPLVCVGLDNIDQLAHPLAEYRFMSDIFSNLVTQLEDIRFLVSLRPSTYQNARNNPYASGPLQGNVNQNRYWVKPTALSLIIHKRIAVELARRRADGPARAFLEQLDRVIDMPVSHDVKLQSQMTTAQLLSAVCANNHRQALECLRALVLSRFKKWDSTTGSALVRRRDDGSSYVAEHIAIRAMFLSDNPQALELSETLPNIYHLPDTAGCASTLLQSRLLECLATSKTAQRPKSVVVSALLSLGYSPADVTRCIDYMRLYRLISEIHQRPNGPSEDVIVLRDRGSSYWRLLRMKLSYIQVCYFTMSLLDAWCDPFQFPEMPHLAQLVSLCDNFLNCIYQDIAFEADHAGTSGTHEWEVICERSPWVLHQELAESVYRQLDALSRTQ